MEAIILLFVYLFFLLVWPFWRHFNIRFFLSEEEAEADHEEWLRRRDFYKGLKRAKGLYLEAYDALTIESLNYQTREDKATIWDKLDSFFNWPRFRKEEPREEISTKIGGFYF